MGPEDLLEQGGACEGVSAQKSEPVCGWCSGPCVAPAADGIRLEGGEQVPPMADGAVVLVFQFGNIGGAAKQGFCLVQPAQGFGVVAELIEHGGELVAGGIIDVGVA